MFVRSLSMQKGILYELAVQLKESLVKMLENVDIDGALAFELLTHFFGPNTNVKLTLKKNNELLKVISSKIDEENISTYLDLMKRNFESPSTEEHYSISDN